ncbi:UNVERIFIED_ORG: hypothetical protein QOE_3003 [Clostridioides difficile F501]
MIFRHAAPARGQDASREAFALKRPIASREIIGRVEAGCRVEPVLA